MDRYVIRVQRGQTVRKSSLGGMKKLKQSRIENLAGVIKLGELERCRTLAKQEGGDFSNLIDCLKSLAKKRPAAEILMKTQIGPVIRSLTKHSNEEVAREAAIVYKTWKRHALRGRSRRNIEVQFDDETLTRRSAARSMIVEALHRNDALFIDQASVIGDLLEEELFRRHKRLLTVDYRRCVRRLVFALRYDSEFRDALRSGSIDACAAVSSRALVSSANSSSKSLSS